MYDPSARMCRRIHSPEFITESALRIPIYAVLREDGSPYPDAGDPDVAEEVVVAMHDAAVFTRLLDERMLGAQRQGRIALRPGLARARRPPAVGSAAGLEAEDMIWPQYREQGALRYRGFTAEQFMHQRFADLKRDLGQGRQTPVALRQPARSTT
ncbi:MAG: thiamine pyrophosphate-dependent enzyme [Arhodomonas sp.]|nr:thiamine pyrophosphate-dependent enzyme [Arhodomonas sp.]